MPSGIKSLLGFEPKHSHGYVLDWWVSLLGGSYCLWGFFVRFLHLTAFLLFVPNTRVLTIAHIGIMENRMEATVLHLGSMGLGIQSMSVSYPKP